MDPEKGEVESHVSPQETEPKAGVFRGFIDSFKPAQIVQYDTSTMTEEEKIAHKTAKSPLSRSLKNRHIQMLALGGSIGTGLFVGSGEVLSGGGPASLLIGYGIIGCMLFATMQALGELAVCFPVSGAFSTYTTRFLHPSLGFAIGWNYAIQWLVVFPLELIAASMTIGYWQSDINSVAWVAIFYVLVIVINLFGVRGYGEAEFVFSIIKVAAVIGFIILGICINTGGVVGGTQGYIGGKFWQDPGALNNGFKGVCSVFVSAAFAFAGTELTGLAAAEAANPRKSIPKACRQVFWRIIMFYIVSLTIVGLLVPYNNSHLLGSSDVDITASPFVIAIESANIKVLPSIFNVVIMIAVLSVGNAAVFGCSRTLAALAEQNLAPKFLGYIDRQGRPMAGICVTAIFGLLCFMSGSSVQTVVFDWLMALSGLSQIFIWMCICASHVRFRRAYKVQGRSTDDLPFKAQTGVWGSILAFVIDVLILIAQFWTALWPIGEEPDPSTFFQNYLAAPVVLVFFFGHLIWYRPRLVRAKDIDLDTGRREVDFERLQEELREEREYLASKNVFYRVYRTWC